MRLALLITILAAMVLGQDCPTLTTPKLCGSSSHVVGLSKCNSTFVDFPVMEPCCRTHAEKADPCDDPDALQKCRSLQVDSFCASASNATCCSMPDLSMKIHFEFEYSNQTCCSVCRCYGDPHCESFSGKADTWVICDARTPKASNKAMCPMSKATCNSQLDHTGSPCQWIQSSSQRTWSIPLQGSPCRAANTATPPQMSMYKIGNDFNVLLNMGERAIIVDLIIQDKQNRYVLNAELCNQFAFVNRTVFPWRTNFGPSGVVPPEPDWLPKKWQWSPVDGKDVLWQVKDLESRLEIQVRCTRTPELVAGKIQYGQTRLNVDITEPLDWTNPIQRPNVDGFCVKNKIAKQGSTSQTDMIDATGSCTALEDDLSTAKILCSPAVTAPGVLECKMGWCKSHLPITDNGLEAQQQCVQDIDAFGWNVQFCTMTHNAKFPATPITSAQCATSANCRECLNYIKDNGLASAVIKYDQAFDPSGPCDTTRAQLPPDLIGFCQKGVKVQYYNSFKDTWETQFAIPSGTCIKDGVLEITQQTDPNLFGRPIRLIQCAAPEGACLENQCSNEVGFKAAIEFQVKNNQYADIFDLFHDGQIICNPSKYNTPHECLGFEPGPVCPCPS